MAGKEGRLVWLQTVGSFDISNEFSRTRAETTLFDNEMREFERLLHEDDEIDESYKSFLTRFLTIEQRVELHAEPKDKDLTKELRVEPHEEPTDKDVTKEQRVEPHEEPKDKDNLSHEGDDNFNSEKQIICPEYELFLKHLKPHGKSYVLEFEKDGVPVSIKYEANIYSDKECDRESMIKNGQLSCQQSDLFEMAECQTKRKLSDEVDKVDVVVRGSPNDMVSDSEYLNLHRNVKREKIHEVNDLQKDGKDKIHSDVEILDSTPICTAGFISPFVPSKTFHMGDGSKQVSGSSASNAYREQLLNILKKPFDSEEYSRHQEAVKCYLDYHPDLRSKLKKYRYKQGKRLNIYRGFFFFLETLTQEGSFKPWMDRECLAVEPGSS